MYVYFIYPHIHIVYISSCTSTAMHTVSCPCRGQLLAWLLGKAHELPGIQGSQATPEGEPFPGEFPDREERQALEELG